MSIFVSLILLVILAVIFDKTCLYLERKGWLYYRHKKPEKGIIGGALEELNALLMPSQRHVIVAKKQEAQCQKKGEDSPDK